MHSVWLRRLLVVLGSVACFSFLFYEFAVWHRLVHVLPIWAAYAFTLTPLARLFAVLGVWWRSRLAVISYVAVTAIDMVLCYSVYDVRASFYGIVGSVLLVGFVWREWPNMSWLPANYSLRRTAA
jgi:hypothetical protein